MTKDVNATTGISLNKRKAQLLCFSWILFFLFLLELMIMFMLDAIGITARFPSGKLMNNLLDALSLVITSSPFIWWSLSRYTKLLEGKESIENSLLLLNKAFDSASEAFVVTNSNAEIIDVNPAFTTVTGYAREEVIGKNPKILQSGRHSIAFYQEMWDSITKDGIWQGEIWNRRKDGEIYPEWMTINCIKNNKQEIMHFISVFTDMTVHKHMEKSLHHMANFDALTGLPNREALYDELKSAINRAALSKNQFALIFFDLDRFKHVNETFGHKVGDELLQMVAKRISSCVQSTDMVCRLAGDEFIILLESVTRVDEIAEVANKILADIALPFKIQEHDMHTTTTLGICVYPEDGTDRTTLMKNADTALYRAIGSGGNSYQFYTAEMNASALERLNLENALRHAVARNELRLYYQPQVDTQTRKIIGMEALVRWSHPELGLISPCVFIPMAEQNGLITEIGNWVLHTACMQTQHWKNAGYILRVGVNMSPRQFQQDNIRSSILNILHETGLDPQQLELEITESMMMSNPEETINLLKGLQEIGVLVAIDDFGTGHSSLSLLKNFPINTLKIDQSFVKDIAENSDDAAIASTIISLAHRLGIKSIAEGVETLEQLEFMVTHDCHEIQGYLFSRPLPTAEFEALLRNGDFIMPPPLY